MQEKPTQETIDQWHRWFAIECNNRAWGLAAKPDREPGENREMLNAAYAAAFHWSKIGQPINNARADLTLAQAHALLGQGEQALHYAQRCLAFFESNAGEDWDLAFVHAAVAHAAAVAGDADLHAKHYALAEQLGQAIQDAEDRAVFADEFTKVPKTVRGDRR